MSGRCSYDTEHMEWKGSQIIRHMALCIHRTSQPNNVLLDCPLYRTKGKCCTINLRLRNQGLACCICVSRSRRHTTPSLMDDRRDMARREMSAQSEQGTRTPGFFERSFAACAAHRAPARGAWRCLRPPGRAAAAGVCAGRAARSDGLQRSPRTQHQTRGMGHVLDHGARLHPARHDAPSLQERDELALGLGIPLDVALRHGQTGMAGEFLHVPETPPNLRHSARGPGNERPAAGMRRTAVHLQ
jgi:hypothetical protein